MLGVVATIFSSQGFGQKKDSPFINKQWYETYSVRGYAQFRYNQVAATNNKLVSDQGDKSVGGTGGFFVRRARVAVSIQPTDDVLVYIQPDLASTPVSGGSSLFLQMRDLYADLFLVSDKSLRLRIGQSKVPFGFENLQSSQNRLTLDRSDNFNSAVKDERDQGMFLYWGTPEIRDRFRMLVDSGLKGSGDYGILGLGVYNGQTAGQSEANRSLHVVARATYPFLVANNQFIETSIQGYTGRYVVKTSDRVQAPNESLDQRVGASLIYYPQPFGVQAEYLIGQGPEWDKQSNTVIQKSLNGGYVMLMYKYNSIIPFSKYQTYNGGKKHETNSPHHTIRESETGVEFQFNKSIEITTAYTHATRSNIQTNSLEEGSFGRVQLQWNY
jgi:hypothetical protein